MKEMEDYKLVIIHGKDSEREGEIEYIGNDKEELHAKCLLDYAKQNYKDIEIFEHLNIRHRPEMIAFFFLHFCNDIVFLNITKDVKTYGHMGFFMLPNDISDIQKDSLYKFSKDIENYKVTISHSLRLEDGILLGEEMSSFNNEDPYQLVDTYFEKIKTSKKGM